MADGDVVGIGVDVGEAVCVGVGIEVATAVAVGVAVGATSGIEVGVLVGRAVLVGGGLGVGDGVLDGDGDNVGVSDGIGAAISTKAVGVAAVDVDVVDGVGVGEASRTGGVLSTQPRTTRALKTAATVTGLHFVSMYLASRLAGSLPGDRKCSSP
ncbi:MAG: hypothetical protein IIB16_10125 [Chloroflexi bacterium]|nr:hypothetical protein [Chloroflexota bacterium]